MTLKLTKQEIMKEIVRCGKKPDYFINTYAKITHPMKGLIPFHLYPFQEDLLENFEDHRFNVILKARQLGISTITAAYVAWMMMFHREKNVLVIATKFSTAANLVKKVKAIIKNLPAWLRISNVDIDNRTSFVLSNGSQIKASSTSGDAGRSEALSLLVIDEAAHVEGLDDLWMGLYPTLSTGGRCIALSTPNGVGNWFHKIYSESESKLNDFYCTKLPWDVHPDRDQAWFEKETRNMSRREIAQELECNFNMSGETVFAPEDMEVYFNMVREPKHRTGFDRNLWMWEERQKDKTYLISADVARGDGKDYSVAMVFKIETMEIVAEYQGKVTPDIFSRVLFDLGQEYGNALLVVENNSVGFAVLDKLKDMRYPNLYHSIKSTHEFVEEYKADQMSNAIAGFSTTSKTRPLIVAKMEEFIRNNLVKIYSSRLLSEMKTFIWNNGRPEAMRSYNDDLIMACAVGCWVRDTALSVNQLQSDYSKAFIGAITKSSNDLDTRIKGMIGVQSLKMKETMNKHQSAVTNFPWLFKG
jgi:hypothetical protein|tara:strand:- start:23 stop:1609 length:1587 start_codon:yes stop_codon:yes gene_type:complete